jgi:hypothetical protein
VLSALVGRRGTTSRTLNSEELFWVEVSFHTRDMMRFRRCQRYGQYRGDLLGSFALAHELHQLAPPRRQLSNVGRDGSNAMPLVTVHNQIGHSWAEPGLPPLQCLHCRHQILGSVGFEYPPANPRFQAVSYDLLGVHGGQDQDYLVQEWCFRIWRAASSPFSSGMQMSQNARTSLPYPVRRADSPQTSQPS